MFKALVDEVTHHHINADYHEYNEGIGQVDDDILVDEENRWMESDHEESNGVSEAEAYHMKYKRKNVHPWREKLKTKVRFMEFTTIVFEGKRLEGLDLYNIKGSILHVILELALKSMFLINVMHINLII